MRHFAASLMTATLLSSAAHAAATSADASDYLTGYVGVYDILDEYENSAQFGVEYRARSIGFGARPTLGFNFDDNGALYGYGGVNFEWPITGNWLFIPNFMVGLYSEGSDGKDLGGAIEFRSGIEVAYELQNTHRVGIAFNHISNASIYDKNPGSETLLINYSVPIGVLGGIFGR